MVADPNIYKQSVNLIMQYYQENSVYLKGVLALYQKMPIGMRKIYVRRVGLTLPWVGGCIRWVSILSPIKAGCHLGGKMSAMMEIIGCYKFENF